MGKHAYIGACIGIYGCVRMGETLTLKVEGTQTQLRLSNLSEIEIKVGERRYEIIADEHQGILIRVHINDEFVGIIAHNYQTPEILYHNSFKSCEEWYKEHEKENQNKEQ